jgi:hypothetical protein
MKQPKRKSAGQRSSPKQPEEANREGIYAADVAYISRVKVESVKGKICRVHIPAKEEPIYFGVHSYIAEHYGVSADMEGPHPSTLDHLVAAASG